MRNIKIFSTTEDRVYEIASAATTWSALQSQISSNISTSNMKAVIKETRLALDSGSSVLPTGEFTIILSAAKMKSGSHLTRLKADKEKYQAVKVRLENFFAIAKSK